MTTRTIEVGMLARVEGEGALRVRTAGGRVEEVQLKIFEPPRFFEALLRGRSYLEAPDITARICGICPVAYQMSTAHAIENAFGIVVPEHIRQLRRLLYCAEWIESHTLHMLMLHAPDFLGVPDALSLGKSHRGMLEKGLRVKKAGNRLLSVLGGRSVHPINVCVGGFHRLPARAELTALSDELTWATGAMKELLGWFGTFDFPDLSADYEFVALSHPTDYPFNEGRIASSRGFEIPQREYEHHFTEHHVEHSTALQSTRTDGGIYLTGPLARFALDGARLSPAAREAAGSVGLGAACTNPFQSILVRAVEVIQALDEALRIIATYDDDAPASVPVAPRPGTGHAATEAPRGLLYHRFELDQEGLITQARIVPPTSQNQRRIEEDLRTVVEQAIDRPEDELRHLCERSIRNHDPCISCATHFLRLTVERS